MTTLIMSCAGKSTRFNLNRPKIFLTHPSGNLMLMEAIYGLGDFSNVDRIVITVVKEHVEKSQVNLGLIQGKIKDTINILPEFLILNNFTKSQSETVEKTIKAKNITGPIFIKDSDNKFACKIPTSNIICVSTLQSDTNAINKSYVQKNDMNLVSNIVEKQVVGDCFCTGGYSFKDAKDFEKSFNILNSLNKPGEIYISHIIKNMLNLGEIFSTIEVKNYSDWGTLDVWNSYTKEFSTIFIDLDGVLVENCSEFFQPQWGNSKELEKNKKIINKLYYENKSHIIITTSRKEIYRELTIKQLEECGIKYHRIIFDLPHCKRVLVNDYSKSNPFPSAATINVKRNEDDLEDYINIFY